MPLGSDPGDDVATLFDRLFSVMPTEAPDLLDAAAALRYQVYCVENAFEDPAIHPGERERDEHDEHSRHAVLIHRPTANVVGCVRLILPHHQNETRELPLSRQLGPDERRRLSSHDRATIAEISRYAVSKQFRRRAGEQLYPDVEAMNITAADARRLFPHVSLGLLRAVGRLAADNHVTTLCAVMSPALLRLLERFGLQFEPLGPVIDYHGLRQPCLASVDALHQSLAREHAEISRFVRATH
jgi:N-acyl amino acid synthase of PEP-CTERM/exosortase system